MEKDERWPWAPGSFVVDEGFQEMWARVCKESNERMFARPALWFWEEGK